MKRFVFLALMAAGTMLGQQPGSFDSTFGTGGKLIAGGGSWLTKMLLQPDGKIVAVGHIAPAGTNNNFVVMRVNTNGTMDMSFGYEGITYTLFGAKCGADALALQPDGKIVVGGYTSDSNSNSGDLDYMIARYNTDGSLDQSFANGGIFSVDIANTQTISGITVLPDGKILAGGQFNSTGARSLIRLDQQGIPDVSFGPGGLKSITITPMQFFHLQEPDMFIIGGLRIGKYNYDGVIDTSFGANGFSQSYSLAGFNTAGEVKLLDNGDFIGVGAYQPAGLYNGFVVMHNADGTVKTGFANNGFIYDTDLPPNYQSFGQSVAESNGTIYVAYSYGPASNYDYRIKAFSTVDGVLQQNFGANGSLIFTIGDNPQYHDYMKVIAIQADGKLITAGNTVGSGFCFARLHTEESLSREEVKKTELAVYPNPATSYINITLNENSEDATFALYDLLGKKVKYYSKAESVVRDGKAMLSLEGIAPGVYTLTTEINGTTTSAKIIKK